MLCICGDKQEADYQVTLYEGEYPSRVALCESCYEATVAKSEVVVVSTRRIERPAELILSTEGWHRILRRYGLPERLGDLRVIVGYEQNSKVILLGVFLFDAYRLLFLDTEMLVTFGHVQDEAGLRECCDRFAESEGATLVR